MQGVIYKPEFIPYKPHIKEEHNLTTNETLCYGFIYFYARSNKFYFSSKQFSEILDVTPGTIDNYVCKLKDKWLIDTETKTIKKAWKFVSRREISLPTPSSSQDENPTSSQDETKESIKKSNKKEPESDKIFKHRLDKEIIQHTELRSSIKKEITKKLKEYSIDEIKKGIDNYSDIYHSKKTFFNHRWTLKEFLKRSNGFEVFLYKEKSDYYTKQHKTVKTNPDKEAYKPKKKKSISDITTARKKLWLD